MIEKAIKLRIIFIFIVRIVFLSSISHLCETILTDGAGGEGGRYVC